MHDSVDAFVRQIGQVIVGKTEAVKLAVSCLLAHGRLLPEDIPGVGKKTLSQALARSLGLGFHRIKFTSDLLPADILGNSIFDRNEQRFTFHGGPLFSQFVLIDEINRATASSTPAPPKAKLTPRGWRALIALILRIPSSPSLIPSQQIFNAYLSGATSR